MTTEFDVIVIGCGVTGAACAMELSKYKLKVGILEKENDVAAGATKANSAIIHAGYDPKEGSLMAKLNVRGAELAKEISEKLCVPYENCGALVVAFSEKDIDHIKMLKARGDANGVPGLEIVDQKKLREMEPQISENAIGALWAPSSSIISPWEYCLAMAEIAVKNGAEIAIEEVNALGGLQFEFNMQDDAHDAEKSVNGYNDLKDWGMQIMMGTVTSTPAEATAAAGARNSTGKRCL